ncbi:cyclic AMP-dependent transcription factor ATF-7 [Zerene cesonia]|uniref:cyclic AMP-dependent transcription factor ATF-7 n=1 Tax=Zerene cesonia TaxID=33412 RepID=UPI0018E53E00|nr:cyclic AMP-dependent transcription factor ATF-7 [Zerene cesonia]
MEPQKPFACTIPDCGMTFTNEDHLHVHTKKHDMVLQLGMEQKAAFAADQTPTPTRFIRNCEEVGLFQDLQNVNVNPFDEGFKRAMETKHNMLSLETSSEDVLHTPHLVFPLDADCTLYTANNQRNITISRSSSDESGAVKEYETTTISKLTNEVTTISRVVKPDSDESKHEKKDVETVSYTNNVIKIHEIRNNGKVNIEKKDLEAPPPIMSQKSLDFVVDSLTSDVSDESRKRDVNDKIKKENNSDDNIEVFIKLPSGKRVKMKAVDDAKTVENGTKEKLKSVISNKKNAAPIIPMPMGTLIPVKVVNTIPVVHKLPIVPLQSNVSVKVRKKCESVMREHASAVEDFDKRSYSSAASKRYRDRKRDVKHQQEMEVQKLRDANLKLSSEVKVLRFILAKHLKKCPVGDDLREVQEKLRIADKIVVDPLLDLNM